MSRCYGILKPLLACILLLLISVTTGKRNHTKVKNEVKNIEIRRAQPGFCSTDGINNDYKPMLLYIPTYLESDNHFEYMKHIWPEILNTSCYFMRCVDAIIHVGMSKVSNRERNLKYHKWRTLLESSQLPFLSTRVMFVRNRGDIYAAAHAARNWFEPYQW